MAKGLGRGINALFKDMDLDSSEETVKDVALKELRPNPYQPRRVFNEEAIEELKQSIQEHGILQPIIARKSIKGYEIVVGERRYRAAKAAELQKVPVVIRKLTDEQMMEMALLENLQREDLTALEEAAAYQSLIERLNITQEELAMKMGKSRSHIANHLRLLSLPPEVQQLITDGALTMGHGRAILGLKEKEQMIQAANKAVKEGLNVRQLEKWIQECNQNVPRETSTPEETKDVFIKEREDVLRERFGTAVRIKQTKNKKKGKIEIEFVSPDDLNRILDLLGQEK
ncbi:ParB/RepB/Spo0J family partition protein [Bacillus thermotolerans]|uniref:Chromosome (Plasmid) partitioning protein ParB n=1 Tax=Bacillus thermotolerans TaxID=1221996 RepID=A0A0F5I217_BACTR|nr:ParB/RepB/Spo0J family partition protein [Bacillus thermotolerans]KKB37464.1 Chromosome (plasmid) partitioning protein ParB [Bacillus thermotolerans]KKB39518.1 Chromosome (plasmid) partitioning protein ParB [Bacillus thermotolerans]KKB44154.1 Chromosome (plasmid) partitioning protein ParB [Bacillus thermotolerans]